MARGRIVPRDLGEVDDRQLAQALAVQIGSIDRERDRPVRTVVGDVVPGEFGERPVSEDDDIHMRSSRLTDRTCGFLERATRTERG